MGQSGSREHADAFQRATSQLSDMQLAEIASRFNEIYARGGSRGGHLLNRENFSNHFQLPVVLGDRLFAAFDINKSGTISFEEFVCGLAICLHGSIIDKAALLFKAFNLNEDEGVSRQEMATILNGSLKSAKAIMQCATEDQSVILYGLNEQEIVQKIVEDAFKNCDITKTGKLLPIEFEYWLKRNPQFMDNIFGAIFLSTNQSVCQSSLTVPDGVTESVSLDVDDQLASKQVDVTSGLLRSEPSLEGIDDECNLEEVISQEDVILNKTVEDSIPIPKDLETALPPKLSPVISGSPSLKSPLEIVDDHYADHSSCETEQAVLSTHNEVEEMQLVFDADGEDSRGEVFSDVVEDMDSPLSSLAHKVHSLTSKLNRHDENETAKSTSSLVSPTTSLSSVPPTPDLEPERKHVAWLPSEHTRQLLNARKTGVELEHRFLTSPGLSIEGPFLDPVTELLKRYGLDQDVRKPMMTADSVVPDPRGFRTLVTNGCFRSALDLAGKFLAANGQGFGSRGQAGALHTHKTLQVWMCRIALLVKLRLYSVAQAELDSFGDFDRPDLYFDFHADIYPEHQGSLVPFSLRLLHAELPQYLGNHNESLDRLYKLLHASQRIESNLESGLAEDGSCIQLSHEQRADSLKLWKSRSVQVMYAIGNCLVGLKDYHLAVSVFESLLEMDPEHKLDLLSGIGRVYLQLGNIAAACSTFREVEAVCGPENEAMVKMNLGMVQVALAKYKEGQQFFQEALQLQPENAVAVNNLAACLVYQGRVKEAVTVLEELVWHNPAESLQESVFFNLCTAYELDSSQSFDKKKSMLSLAATHHGDNFNVDCLKIGL